MDHTDTRDVRDLAETARRATTDLTVALDRTAQDWREFTRHLKAVYTERTAILAALATHPDIEATLGHDDKEDDEFATVLTLTTPQGQMTWHIHRDDLPLISHLPGDGPAWDGHTTLTKYERLRSFVDGW